MGLAFLMLEGAALPQSLAEVARKEEERRKAIKTPSKVYTDQDLKRDPGGQVTPPAAAGGQPAVGSQPSSSASARKEEPKESKAQEPAKDQKYWNDRIAAARNQLARSKLFLEGLQTRVNSLSADFVNRDDPAQRAVIERDRQNTVRELERLKKEVQDQTKAVADIEEEARRAGVPPGWLR